jgi:hypothetical protein
VFFHHQIRTIPSINPNFWSFAITGAVRHPLILSYADLQALPAQTFHSVIACAGMSKDRPLIGEAIWRGVPLITLLDEVIAGSSVRYAHIHSADRYTTVMPLDRLAQAFLVYEMDDAPLSPEHGFPARLITPGLSGYKMAKWIERIELSASSEGGFWESRGWSLEGTARVKAAILSREQRPDGNINFSGIAYAGERPITRVQISIDGGDWMPIPFTTDEILTRWQIDWMPPHAGEYEVRLLASAGDDQDTHTHRLTLRTH